MSDFDEPDLEMVDIRVAARHSGIPGSVPDADLQNTCHLSSVTASVLKLKKPSCVRHEEQKTLRFRGGVSIKSWLADDPWSKPEREN